MRPATDCGTHKVLLGASSHSYLFHPKLVVASDLQFSRDLGLYLHGSTEGLLIVGLMFDGFGLLAMADDVVDQLRHAFLAFEAVALDAIEALCVRFLSELFFFVGQHYIYILLFAETISMQTSSQLSLSPL